MIRFNGIEIESLSYNTDSVETLSVGPVSNKTNINVNNSSITPPPVGNTYNCVISDFTFDENDPTCVNGYTGSDLYIQIPSSYSIGEVQKYQDGLKFNTSSAEMMYGSSGYDSFGTAIIKTESGEEITFYTKFTGIQSYGSEVYLLYIDGISPYSFSLGGIGADIYDKAFSCNNQRFNNESEFSSWLQEQMPDSLDFRCYYTATGPVAGNTYTVTNIGADFKRLNIKGLKIPATINSIYYTSIIEMFDLQELIVDSNNTTYDSRNNCNAIIETATNTLIKGCANTEVPSDVNIIDKYAFTACYALRKFTIPANVTTIGYYAFAKCYNLIQLKIASTSLTLSPSQSSLISGPSQFKYCYNLVEIYNVSNIAITAGVDSDSNGNAGAYAKIVHNNLTDASNIQLIDNLYYYVSDNDFIMLCCDAYSTYHKLTLDSRTTAISNYALSHSVDALYELDFTGCTNLTAIGTHAFQDPIISGPPPYKRNMFFNLLDLSPCTNLQAVSGFSANQKLELILFPPNATSVNGFGSSSKLSKLCIPYGVTRFSGCLGCDGLKYVDLPSSITSIADSSFRSCDNLKTLVMRATTPPTLGNQYVFDNKYANTSCPLSVIYIPKGSLSAYTSATYWSNLASKFKEVEGLEKDHTYVCNLSDFTFNNSTITKYTGMNPFIELPSSYSLQATTVTLPGALCYSSNIYSYIGGNGSYGMFDNITLTTIDGTVLTYQYGSMDDITQYGDEIYLTSISGVDSYSLSTAIFKEWPVYCNNQTFSDSSEFETYVQGQEYGAEYSFGGEVEKDVPVQGNDYQVTALGGAFQTSKNLRGIKIPAAITTLTGAQFSSGCAQLEEIIVDSNHPNYYSYQNKAIISKDNTKLIRALDNFINIPDTITELSDGAYRHNSDEISSLTKIQLPSNLLTIGKMAFGYCNNLKSIAIPSTVTKIDEQAFWYCTKLEQITIPADSSLTTLVSHCFAHCTSLLSIDLPTGISIIPNSAFDSCESLTTLTIPYGVTSIGQWAFYHCKNLKTINLPNTLSTLNERALQDMVSLEEINANGSKYISQDGILYAKSSSSYILTRYPSAKTAVSFTPRTNTITIGTYAFEGVHAVQAFVGNSGLKTIESNAFRDTSFVSIDLPSSITSIKSSAFTSNDNITTFILRATTPPTLQSTSGVSGSFNIQVPSGSLNTYKNATNWKNASIKNRLVAIS